jgi:sister chromatid cohesion protein DCC1
VKISQLLHRTSFCRTEGRTRSYARLALVFPLIETTGRAKGRVVDEPTFVQKNCDQSYLNIIVESNDIRRCLRTPLPFLPSPSRTHTHNNPSDSSNCPPNYWSFSRPTIRLRSIPDLTLLAIESELTKSTRLYLKSSNPPTNVASATTPRTKGVELGYVHLCSPTQTYQVQQVSTSNSLFVAQPAMLLNPNTPTNQPKGETDATHEDGFAPSAISALKAIGQVKSVLELKPVQLDVQGLLQSVVPVWKWSNTETIGIDEVATNGVAVSKEEIFDQLPAPETQIEDAWRRLFAFEVRGYGYIPDQETLYRAWKEVMDIFVGEEGREAKLSADIFLGGGHLREDDNRELLEVVRRSIWWSPVLRKPRGTATGQDEDGELDETITTAWVGQLVLQHMAGRDQPVSVEQFMVVWRNLLPEKWGRGVGIDALRQESYRLETSVDGVAMIKTGLRTGRAADSSTKETGGLESVTRDPNARAETAGKRKWHEKFKDSRNVKR